MLMYLNLVLSYVLYYVSPIRQNNIQLKSSFLNVLLGFQIDRNEKTQTSPKKNIAKLYKLNFY